MIHVWHALVGLGFVLLHLTAAVNVPAANVTLAPQAAFCTPTLLRRNMTGLLVSTRWLNGWIEGPPPIDLQYPWGSSGTWQIASSQTIQDLLQDLRELGGGVSLLVPAFVNKTYANRTVVLDVYDVGKAFGTSLLRVIEALNQTTTTVIVTVRGNITVSTKNNTTTMRYNMTCNTDVWLSNISAAKWLALNQLTLYNVSTLVQPNNSTRDDLKAAIVESTTPSVATNDNLYLFIAVTVAVAVSGVAAVFCVSRAVKRNRELLLRRKQRAMMIANGEVNEMATSSGLHVPPQEHTDSNNSGSNPEEPNGTPQ
jgi:hypothetical protein